MQQLTLMPIKMFSLLCLCSADELYAYLTHSRPDLCILEGGEEEGEADHEEEEFVLIKEKDEVEQEEEVEEEEVCHRLRNPGEDWEVSWALFSHTGGGVARNHKVIL